MGKLGKKLLPQALKSCPKCNKSPNLVTLLTSFHFLPFTRTTHPPNQSLSLSLSPTFSQSSVGNTPSQPFTHSLSLVATHFLSPFSLSLTHSLTLVHLLLLLRLRRQHDSSMIWKFKVKIQRTWKRKRERERKKISLFFISFLKFFKIIFFWICVFGLLRPMDGWIGFSPTTTDNYFHSIHRKTVESIVSLLPVF